ncbi:MAG: DUF3786 domain-containing protein [Desulfobulbaceae bacterium]
MQPLEFIKFTPKTNCGECGYAACLAFAAAVTKGGEEPGKCPYVDLKRLGDEFSRAERGKGGLSGVAGLLDDKDMALVAHLKSKVREVDFSAAAPALGCDWSGPETDCLHFRYLGRDVTLSAEGMSVAGHELEDPRDQILLYNYVYYGGGDAGTGEWVGMESLPNSISKVRTLRVYCEERIAGHFCGREVVLRQCAAKIDAVPRNELEQSCTAAFQVAVLPRLAIVLLFWDEEPEDGFPPRVKVLYDSNVLSVLDIESLVFASERMAERLVELSGYE